MLMKLSPFQIFNQYSFFVLVALVTILGSTFLWWRKAGPLWWVGLIVALVALAGYALTSRVQQLQPAAIKLDSVENIRTTLRKSGKPSLVEFYSNY